MKFDGKMNKIKEKKVKKEKNQSKSEEQTDILGPKIVKMRTKVDLDSRKSSRSKID